MAETKKYLDWEGLSYYDGLIKGYVDDSIKLGEELTTNVTCGACVAGSTFSKNDSLIDIIKKLTTSVLQPSKKNNPSVSLSSSISSGTVVEVGTIITPTLTPKFNDGTFNSYDKGALEPKTISAGCVVTNCVINRGNTPISTTDTLQAVTDSYAIKNETVSYDADITYSSSTVKPTNSNGEEVELSYTGTTKTTSAIKITGKYQYYCAAVNSDPTVDEIRTALNGKTNWVSSGTVIEDVEMSTLKMALAIPSHLSLIKAMTSNNQNVTTDFIETPITISDAGNGTMSYKLYVMTTTTQASFTIDFTIQ